MAILTAEPSARASERPTHSAQKAKRTDQRGFMADHMLRYNLALLGDFPEATSNATRGEIATRIKELGLMPGNDLSLYQGGPQGFNPSIDRCCAALYAQIAPTDEAMIEHLITRRVPLIPVASSPAAFAAEFPGKLGELNGAPMTLCPGMLASALLEVGSLIPRQRRVFLSYRRAESTM